MDEKKMVYVSSNGMFSLPSLSVETYRNEYFQLELDLESELFYDLRKENGWQPFRINESPEAELQEIQAFFTAHRETFYFLFSSADLIGSILVIGNFIQCLSINRKYQRKGYGSYLTKYAVNEIIGKGFPTVELKVLANNEPAIQMYQNIGFEVVNENIE